MFSCFDEHAASEAGGEPEYVDERKYLIPHHVSPGDPEIVFDHFKVCFFFLQTPYEPRIGV